MFHVKHFHIFERTDTMDELTSKGSLAKKAALALASKGTSAKNDALLRIADNLIKNTDNILSANKLDTEAAKQKGISDALLDRLTLTPKRIEEIADGVRQVAALPDPIGEMISLVTRPNGLQIGKTRVPLGVIGIIYEARPNVTVDAAVLCVKAGNAVILRGGSEAINANKALVSIMQEACQQAGLPKESVQLVENVSRETAVELMRLNDYLDVLIPRGGAGLIQTVVQNATVPVIETGVGNCHAFVDETADIDMAANIIFNAKTSRPSVCNALETVLIHRARITETAKILDRLAKANVEIRGCEEIVKIYQSASLATEEDWYKEYGDYIIAVRIVNDIGEAIAHINKYGSGHSDVIITENYTNALRFHKEVDSAAVYVNASTRFTDGFEFGLGAEIGISTQKMHARGPMGLYELTSTKHIIFGNGQIR